MRYVRLSSRSLARARACVRSHYDTTTRITINSPEDYRRGNAELDEYLLDVTVQRLFVQVPGCLIVRRSSSGGIGRTAQAVYGARLGRKQFVQKSLGGRQNLLRQLADEVLRKLLQLLSVQSRQGLADWRPQAYLRRLKKSAEYDRIMLNNHLLFPIGIGTMTSTARTRIMATQFAVSVCYIRKKDWNGRFGRLD